MAKQTWIVSEDTKERLDKYLSSNTELSRTRVQQLADDGMIFVNGKVAKSSLKVVSGDEISCDVPDDRPVDILPENIPLDILYEDSDIIVINKPKGMVVHPAPGNYSNTMVNALLYHCKDLSGINGVIRPWHARARCPAGMAGPREWAPKPGRRAAAAAMARPAQASAGVVGCEDVGEFRQTLCSARTVRMGLQVAGFGWVRVRLGGVRPCRGVAARVVPGRVRPGRLVGVGVREKQPQIEVGCRQGARSLFGPLHQHQPGTGKYIVKPGIEPLVRRREPI